MSTVKLPGAAAFIPPARPQGPAASVVEARSLEQRSDRESFGDTVGIDARAPGLAAERLLYKTKAPWLGIDVFLLPIPPVGGFSQQGTLSVFIYAIVSGIRVLVASGRYACFTGAPVLQQRWIAGARTIASLFEVTAQWTQFTGAPAAVGGQMAFAIEASNQAVDLPEYLGAEVATDVYLQTPAGGGVATGIGVNIAGVQIPPRLELLTVRASNGAAAARFLQLFDQNTPPIPANGSVPRMEWPLGAVIGAGIGSQEVLYRSKNRIMLVASSTPGALTVQTDVAISAEVR